MCVYLYIQTHTHTHIYSSIWENPLGLFLWYPVYSVSGKILCKVSNPVLLWQMEVLMLCVLVMEIIISAVLTKWIYVEQRSHSKWAKPFLGGQHPKDILQLEMCSQYIQLGNKDMMLQYAVKQLTSTLLVLRALEKLRSTSFCSTYAC